MKPAFLEKEPTSPEPPAAGTMGSREVTWPDPHRMAMRQKHGRPRGPAGTPPTPASGEGTGGGTETPATGHRGALC